MSKATSQAFSSYRRNRTVLSFRERYRPTVYVSNGTVAVMAQRGVSLKSVLTCYEKNKMIFFFIWAVIDFMTINISWFLLNIKQHPSPISRKPQTVLNGWMAWIVCIVLFSYHKCACPMSRAIAATFWLRGRRALRARRPRGPNVKSFAQEFRLHAKFCNMYRVYCLNFILNDWKVQLENTHFMKRVLKCDRLFSSEYELNSNSLQIIGIHNTGHALQNTIYINGWHARADSASLKSLPIAAATVGDITDLKLFARCIVLICFVFKGWYCVVLCSFNLWASRMSSWPSRNI